MRNLTVEMGITFLQARQVRSCWHRLYCGSGARHGALPLGRRATKTGPEPLSASVDVLYAYKYLEAVLVRLDVASRTSGSLSRKMVFCENEWVFIRLAVT